MRLFPIFALILALLPTIAIKTSAAEPRTLHVQGNLLKTTRGQTIRLQGVNVAGMEWSNNGEGRILQSVKVAIEQWHSNAIRLPLSQDRWFGRAEGQKDDGADYRALVDSIVTYISGKNSYVILDLHWNNAGDWGKHIGQHRMPDAHSVEFWADVAKRYANRPAVLFDLYNEPHDISWDVWKNGGSVSETNKGEKLSYQSPGMQKLIDTVRAAGAKNVVVIGGNDWAFDLSGLKNYALSDAKGNGIVYATHIYPWKNDTRWDTCITAVADKYPILVGEVGCQPDPKQEEPKTWVPKVLAYIGKHQFNWTAWCFHPKASPCILADWNFTPTPYWGEFVKNALKQP